MIRIIALLGALLTVAACAQPVPETAEPVSRAAPTEVNLQSTAPDQPGLPPQVEVVTGHPNYSAGDIVIVNSAHRLYLIQDDGTALSYPIGVGTESQRWTGSETITRKAMWPSWTPTAAMISRNPGLYARHAGGMAGGPSNPLGARALYLGNTFYRIHGTPDAGRIGNSASNGCINMYQSHVIDLYERVQVGTRVHVIN